MPAGFKFNKHEEQEDAELKRAYDELKSWKAETSWRKLGIIKDHDAVITHKSSNSNIYYWEVTRDCHELVKNGRAYSLKDAIKNIKLTIKYIKLGDKIDNF